MPYKPDSESIFANALAEHLSVVQQLVEQKNILEAIARDMVTTLHAGRKILWCGNGGSAADSQHLAAEIVGRFRRERCGLPSIALTTDSSILTAIANDYGYEKVFARQVEALGTAGDMLVGISTSGNSPNVVSAIKAAQSCGLLTVAFTGSKGGTIGKMTRHHLAVPSSDTARIQEAHILAGHMLCDWVELDWLQTQPTADE